ncbi:hypothetical protein H310_08034 [Aphanomyces invadans]|uniref:Uncharacterized protein n=1 Tax=Aphanomyces invadans TaxID=157072 RepID=A0A024U113_9STRA|nr:hypothetical protein H310_08034 [Aphanomyces invadans]ETV99302.1 hypothetical protein H310_08034 [Aphanomyces invadans]|eukprot:XP_008871858.1 hypothetical protein H310_08034 [Aphanomyces invadans]
MYTAVTTAVARCKDLSLSCVDDAKHNILVVCIALVHALHGIQERLHLESSLHILVQAEQHLRNLLQAEQYLSSTSTSLDEEANVTSILMSAWAWLHDLAMSTYDYLYTHLTYVPGVSRLLVWIQTRYYAPPTACGDESSLSQPAPVDKFTAIVLSYTEKDIPVSSSLNHRIQRSMHYPINLKPFDAKIQLQSTASYAATSTLKSPQSMPASPTARLHWQSSLASLSQNVLYQVRDQLRAEQAAVLTGSTHLTIVKFNRHDCHVELQLSCGAHAVTKVLPGLYRTVRATDSIPRDRAVYFEMTVHDRAVSCCIGLSPRSLPCNALIGTQKHTIGVYSKSGMILAHSLQIPVPGLSSHSAMSNVSTYGVLVHRASCIDPATSAPTAVDCVQVVFTRFDNSSSSAMVVSEQCELRVPATVDLFPTVTLDSMHHTILSRFAATDLIVSVDQWAMVAYQYPTIYSMDGTLCSAYKETDGEGTSGSNGT